MATTCPLPSPLLFAEDATRATLTDAQRLAGLICGDLSVLNAILYEHAALIKCLVEQANSGAMDGAQGVQGDIGSKGDTGAQGVAGMDCLPQNCGSGPVPQAIATLAGTPAAADLPDGFQGWFINSSANTLQQFANVGGNIIPLSAAVAL